MRACVCVCVCACACVCVCVIHVWHSRSPLNGTKKYSTRHSVDDNHSRPKLNFKEVLELSGAHGSESRRHYSSKRPSHAPSFLSPRLCPNCFTRRQRAHNYERLPTGIISHPNKQDTDRFKKKKTRKLYWAVC